MINIFIIGDSHSLIFNTEKPIKNKYNFIDRHLNATSISGLNNENSTLKYGAFIKSLIPNFTKENFVIFHLGQVDLETIYWYKVCAKNENININNFIDDLIIKYKKFIVESEIINKTNIVIHGVHLPCYYSNEYIIERLPEVWCELNKNIITNIDSYKKKLKELNITINILTYNNLLFNNKLKIMCEELNILYFDTTNFFIDEKTETLKDIFVGNPPNGPLHNKDVHYKSIFDKTSIKPSIITINAFIDLISQIS
jgi:hypothetical protein